MCVAAMEPSNRRNADLFFADLLGHAPSSRRTPTAPQETLRSDLRRVYDRIVHGKDPDEAFESDWEVVALPSSSTPHTAVCSGDVAFVRAMGEGRLTSARVVGRDVDARSLYHPDGRLREDTMVVRRVQPQAIETAPTAKFGGQLWTFRSTALSRTIAVFCPRAAASLTEVESLLLVHGLNTCSPPERTPPASYIGEPPFELGRIVAATNRGLVLVVPQITWRGQEPDALGEPAKVNALMDEVLAELARVGGRTAPTLSNLIIAGHSRAYGVLDPLAKRHAHAEMSRGALAKLSRVWAFDITYGQWAPVDEYVEWLNAKPNLQIDLFYRANSATEARGKRFEDAMGRSGGRLRVTISPELHCDVPGRRLPDLLARPPAQVGAPASATEDASDELRTRRRALVGSLSESDLQWIDVSLADGYTIKVCAPVRKNDFYVPVTGPETFTLSRRFGGYPLSRAVFDQLHNAYQLADKPRSPDNLLDFELYSRRMKEAFGDYYGVTMCSGAHKLWVVSTRGTIINYGFHKRRARGEPFRGGRYLDSSRFTLIQGLGAAHATHVGHWDYSQLLQIMKDLRDSSGRAVDLRRALLDGLPAIWDEATKIPAANLPPE
jgi:hypothetical protein